jgi:NAD(P)H dehydrogenase (quinone)
LTASRCLIVLAHPLGESLNARLAAAIEGEARAAGWDVTLRDLYRDNFDPCLSMAERSAYYATPPSDAPAVERAELSAAEILILVFPTWWFGFPAVLKGWFDRVWAPGTAFDHSPGFGSMLPRLGKLREVLAVTTMGSPAWVDWLVMRRPLPRILRLAIVKPCAPQARVVWSALYRTEALRAEKVQGFETRVRAEIKAIAQRIPCPD